jgi:rhodanese-related sulfurtransferase
MNTISSKELRHLLDGHEPVQLVMALDSWAYDRLHIPGSVGLESLADLLLSQERDREVIVYDTNPACPASYRVYQLLKSQGFTRVQRFAGGMEEWLEAGYPVEGSLAMNSQAENSLMGDRAWATA